MPMSAKRPAESLSNAENSNEWALVTRNGDAKPLGMHAKLNGGIAWGIPASARPVSDSSIVKRMRSSGLSTASGVDSKDEEVDSEA